MSAPSTRLRPLAFAGLIFLAESAPARKVPWPLYATTYNPLRLVSDGAVTTLSLWPLLNAYDAALPGSQRRVA